MLGAGGAGADPKDRNKIVMAGLGAVSKSKPAAFFVPQNAGLITPGNFDDHLERVAEAVWIVEAAKAQRPWTHMEHVMMQP